MYRLKHSYPSSLDLSIHEKNKRWLFLEIWGHGALRDWSVTLCEMNKYLGTWECGWDEMRWDGMKGLKGMRWWTSRDECLRMKDVYTQVCNICIYRSVGLSVCLFVWLPPNLDIYTYFKYYLLYQMSIYLPIYLYTHFPTILSNPIKKK